MNEVLEKQLIKKIERLEMLEERMGVKFEKLNLKIKFEDRIYIYLEVHPIKGLELEKNVTVEAVLYDSADDIIQVKNKYLYSDDFYAFEVLEIEMSSIDVDNINRIRLYPKT